MGTSTKGRELNDSRVGYQVNYLECFRYLCHSNCEWQYRPDRSPKLDIHFCHHLFKIYEYLILSNIALLRLTLPVQSSNGMPLTVGSKYHLERLEVIHFDRTIRVSKCQEFSMLVYL